MRIDRTRRFVRNFALRSILFVLDSAHGTKCFLGLVARFVVANRFFRKLLPWASMSSIFLQFIRSARPTAKAKIIRVQRRRPTRVVHGQLAQRRAGTRLSIPNSAIWMIFAVWLSRRSP